MCDIVIFGSKRIFYISSFASYSRYCNITAAARRKIIIIIIIIVFLNFHHHIHLYHIIYIYLMNSRKPENDDTNDELDFLCDDNYHFCFN